MLRYPTLEDDYDKAWPEWSGSGNSKAQAEQIRSVATGRLRRRIGRVSSVELARLDDVLRLHLDV